MGPKPALLSTPLFDRLKFRATSNRPYAAITPSALS